MATSAMAFGSLNRFFAGSPAQATGSNYDMAAIMNGEPGEMFDTAIQSLGGMDAFVSKGQTVVVKPNIGWDAVPERAANTNPELIRRIIERCYESGASEVYVFDYTCDEWRNC